MIAYKICLQNWREKRWTFYQFITWSLATSLSKRSYFGQQRLWPKCHLLLLILFELLPSDLAASPRAKGKGGLVWHFPKANPMNIEQLFKALKIYSGKLVLLFASCQLKISWHNLWHCVFPTLFIWCFSCLALEAVAHGLMSIHILVTDPSNTSLT